jgi:cell division protein FtsI/penicillin-binding protein 2
MRREYARRSLWVTTFLPFFAILILGQIVRIQISPEAKDFIESARANAMVLRTFYPERGEIYDRKGHLLAGNETVYTMGVDLPSMVDPESLASNLSAYLGVNYDETLRLLTDEEYQKTLNKDGLLFATIRSDVSAEEAVPLIKIYDEMEKQAEKTGQPSALSGLEFHPALQRSYPEESLASNVIGFVTGEGHGIFGVEGKYDSLLAGNQVQARVPRDPSRAAEIPKVPNGTTLILTLERDLQAEAESALDQALFDYGAQSGSIVIMDPRSGEILAMAVNLRMDLNRLSNYGAIYEHSEFNPAISTPYEPGSVFKVLTMAAALDNGTVTPGTLFNDTGVIVVGEVPIQNWDRRAWGTQDMTGCLQHSLNVCLAWVSTSMGADAFYGYMERFGIGHPTGIDLAGEASGHLKVPVVTDDYGWFPVDLGTNAFGQGVAVTPVQMLMAASAIANDGRMVVPHVLSGMVRDGRQYNMQPPSAGSPIRAETAHTLNQMLAVSLENEASLALVPGYRVAGKTGTAQVPVNGYYDPNVTNASFIGWGPVDDPQFMIYIWLERPSVSPWANDTAAPLFSEIAQKTVILLDIPPDAVRLQLASQ